MKAGEDARMAKLYREVILKEKPVEGGFVPLDMLTGGFGIKAAASAPVKPEGKKEEREEVGSFGD
jgi:hypothetical protein